MVTDHSNPKNPFRDSQGSPAGPSSPPEYTAEIPDLVSVSATSPSLDRASVDILVTLESRIQEYNKATDPAIKRSIGDSVHESMSQIAENHSDPKVRKLWKKKAKEFQKKRQKKRDNLFIEFLRGMMMLIAGPFLLVGSLTIMVGEVVRGVGTFLIYGRIGDKQIIGRADVV